VKDKTVKGTKMHVKEVVKDRQKLDKMRKDDNNESLTKHSGTIAVLKS